jgi:uncharacterized protein YciI
MKEFLYRIQPTRLGMLTEGPTEHESEIIDEHFEYLQKLVAQGVVFTAGRTQNAGERTFGIVIFAADSDSEAGELMRNDPAVSSGVMRGELFPYRTALWSPIDPTAEENGD